MAARLDAWHSWARHCPVLQRFTVFTRLILGIGFIAPGLTKFLGHRFTSLGLDTPVGFFFEAMYRTGFYWRFLGAAQILAALLTLIPRTATLGALTFFPIILNIFIITVSMDFRGTPFITGAMLCANLYLLSWDYHKFKPLLFGEQLLGQAVHFTEVEPHWIERVGYCITVIVGFILTLILRGLFGQLSGKWVGAILSLGFLGGLLILSGWLILARQHWKADRAI
jgi:hypothetical protein